MQFIRAQNSEGLQNVPLLSSELQIIFILHLIKFLWNVLMFSRQLATLLWGVWEHQEEKYLAPASSLHLQLCLGRLSIRMVMPFLSHHCGLWSHSLWSSYCFGHREGRIWENAFQCLGGPTQCQAPSPAPGTAAVTAARGSYCESWCFIGTNSSPNGRLTWVAMESRFQSCPWNVNFSWKLSTLPLREQQASTYSHQESIKETQIIAIPINSGLSSFSNKLVRMA